MTAILHLIVTVLARVMCGRKIKCLTSWPACRAHGEFTQVNDKLDNNVCDYPLSQFTQKLIQHTAILIGGVRCSSVVRAFAHGVMGRRIDPSWGEPIELFLVPASAPRLV